MNARAIITAVIFGIGTGVAFVVTSGTIHGLTLVLTQAGLAAVDAAGTALGITWTGNAATNRSPQI